MPTIQQRTNKALREVEEIHSLLHPMGDSDPQQNLYQARSRREDAVRVTVIQVSLALEDVLDGLFWRVFLGHDPDSKRRGSRTRGPARELDGLLRSGRMGFEAKLKLARVVGIITKKQHSKLDSLRTLRNRCAHAWMLDAVHKRGRRPRPTRRVLEYKGKNLFDIKVLKDFMSEYGGIYLKLFGKYLS